MERRTLSIWFLVPIGLARLVPFIKFTEISSIDKLNRRTFINSSIKSEELAGACTIFYISPLYSLQPLFVNSE